MRYYLFCIQFFLLVSIGISQNAANKVYTVKKDKIATLKSLNQIIPDFPKKHHMGFYGNYSKRRWQTRHKAF